MWCIPPKQSAEFVAKMEDVLEVYSKPFDKDLPVVCMDEKPYQLLEDGAKPIKMSKNNHIERFDCEYERRGVCSIFMFNEPLAGWRHAEARQRRTAVDWAQMIKWLVDEPYKNHKKIILVLDNLNTHTIASLYKAFLPSEALRIAKKLEIHFTPKHGSWLNMAEIELSALSIQCLGQDRIASIETLNKRMSAWHTQRNLTQKGIDWLFETKDARTSLRHVYPELKF